MNQEEIQDFFNKKSNFKLTNSAFEELFYKVYRVNGNQVNSFYEVVAICAQNETNTHYTTPEPFLLNLRRNIRKRK